VREIRGVFACSLTRVVGKSRRIGACKKAASFLQQGVNTVPEG
jgi:hypothetical protein